MRARRIALAGYYAHGNFGDDCYATLLGRELRLWQVPVTVYGLRDAYARPLEIPVSRSAEELLEGAGWLLWGGGGLLVPWPGLLYEVLFRGVSERFQHLIERAISKGMRLAACSVGGDGSCPDRLTPHYKETFLSAAEFITVRNPQDLALLERAGVAGVHYPDLMWLAAERLGQPQRQVGGMRIGVELYPSTLLRNSAPHLIPVFQQLVNERKDSHFVFLDSTNAGCKPYRGLGRFLFGANTKTHQFTALESDLEFLASLDLLITNRLHTAMVALQYGVPVLSLMAEGKTRLLFTNLERDAYSFGHGRILELYRLIRDKRSLDGLLAGYRFPDIARLGKEAAGHLSFLRERVT